MVKVVNCKVVVAGLFFSQRECCLNVFSHNELLFFAFDRSADVVGRDAVTPPELTADAPVLDIFEPIAICRFVLVRHKFDVVVHYRRESDFCEVLHVNEPLQ